MAYQPIEHHGVIGNMHTAALVALDGSIDWFCVPRFDSPSVFGAILDDRKGGRFRIGAPDNFRRSQYYLPETNVLVTRFAGEAGSAEITDFMPITDKKRGRAAPLIRVLTGKRGSVPIEVEIHAAFNYGRDSHHTELTQRGAILRTESLSLGISTSAELQKSDDDAIIRSSLTVEEGQSVAFVLRALKLDEELPHPLSAREAQALIQETVEYWRGWIGKCSYSGRWREMVHRSALALELLVYEPTGAIVAAPTASLPECIGGERNWDYRSSWMRDSAFTVYALLRIGLTDEADRFMRWLEAGAMSIQPDGSLQTLYGIDGRQRLDEQVLTHWEGYRGSRPVRIGNAAYQQSQLDIYGELMDAVYLYDKHASPISLELWRDIRKLLDWVCGNWQSPDSSIWEVRGEPKDFVYSKLMCWVAFDRGLRIAASHSLPGDTGCWLNTRDEIFEQIISKGWSQKRNAFVQSYGSDVLDAALLRMPLVYFLAAGDPLMRRTLDAISRPPSQRGLMSDDMVYRYKTSETDDGLSGSEGNFNMCTFWLVEALTRAGRGDPSQLLKARRIFERMLAQANHLGLYSEETGPSGEALGNFPQAFTHLSFITAALHLDEALDSHSAPEIA